MNKLVVNHLEKIFVTSDAATIVQELEVAHPAARMLTMAAKMQEQEMGDGTNFVITFAGKHPQPRPPLAFQQLLFILRAPTNSSRRRTALSGGESSPHWRARL